MHPVPNKCKSPEKGSFPDWKKALNHNTRISQIELFVTEMVSITEENFKAFFFWMVVLLQE